MQLKRGLYIVLVLLICLPIVYSFEVPDLPPPLPDGGMVLPDAPPAPGEGVASGNQNGGSNNGGGSNGGSHGNPFNHTYSDVYQKDADSPVSDSDSSYTSQSNDNVDEIKEGEIYANTPEPEKKSNAGLIIFIVSLAVIGLGVGGYFAYNHFKSNEANPDSIVGMIVDSQPTIAIILILVIALSGVAFVYFGSGIVGYSVNMDAFAGDVRYNNYAPPRDVQDQQDVFVLSTANGLMDTTTNLVDLNGVVTNIGGLIWDTGYYYTSTGWKEIKLQGVEAVPAETHWIANTAIINIPVTSEGLDLVGENFIVVYTCKKDAANAWKCGCRDQACAQDKKWRVQTFVVVPKVVAQAGVQANVAGGDIVDTEGVPLKMIGEECGINSDCATHFCKGNAFGEGKVCAIGGAYSICTENIQCASGSCIPIGGGAQGNWCASSEEIAGILECQTNADCLEGKVCKNNACVTCVTDNDCDDLSFCRRRVVDGPLKCLKPIPLACVDSEECTAGAICEDKGTGNKCYGTLGNSCAGNDFCANGFECVDGKCFVRESCNDGVKNGLETDIDCGGSCTSCSAERSCNVIDDCATGLVCSYQNICALCRYNSECPVDLFCFNHACVVCADGNVKPAFCPSGVEVQQSCVNGQWEDIDSKCVVPAEKSANLILLNYNFNQEGAIDLSGNGFNGVVSGATYVPNSGIKGSGAYSFDGLNDWIDVVEKNEFAFNKDSSFSIALLMKSVMAPGSGAALIDRRGEKGWVARMTNDRADLFFDWGSNAQKANCVDSVSGTNINDGVWHHIVYIYSNLEIKVYVDGILDQTCARNVDIFQDNIDLRIGAAEIAGQYPFKGILDEIIIFNSVLSEDVIRGMAQSYLA